MLMDLFPKFTTIPKLKLFLHTVLNLDSTIVTTDANKATLNIYIFIHFVFTTSSSTIPDMSNPLIESLQSIDISETVLNKS